MLLKYFYDPLLAHASYMVGCQKAKQAIIVDPGRDIEPYLSAAKEKGMEIVAAAETHIHADYVSGARELAERVGAKLYVSNAGPVDWKYQYLDGYDSERLSDGDTFALGKIKFEVVHTPGHTPESISFLLTDQGGGADQPMGIFTGDFVFVGSIGRPDLLEEAAGVAGSADEGARQLYQSVQRFRQLPDYLQVWPAHGAGSACGKGLGAIPSSTVGYEKRFNPALQIEDEEDFVKYILSEQPEAPAYFAVMKRVNKEGPELLGTAGQLQEVSVEKLQDAKDAELLDVSDSDKFGKKHIEGSLNIPVKMLASWAGWLLDYERPVYLIADQNQVETSVTVLEKIGVPKLEGYFDRQKLEADRKLTQSYPSVTASDAQQQVEEGKAKLIDVRSQSEWEQGHIPQAEHFFLGKLTETAGQLSKDQPLLVQCQSGARSAIATSLLQSKGFDVTNLEGGFNAWKKSDRPTTESEAGCCSIS